MLLLALLVVLSCAEGEQAVERMTPEEQRFLLEKVETITAGMSRQEVEAILGPGYRLHPSMRPTWLGPDKTPSSQIAVYFRDGKVFKVRWMKLGFFIWEKDFRDSR